MAHESLELHPVYQLERILCGEPECYGPGQVLGCCGAIACRDHEVREHLSCGVPLLITKTNS